MTSCSRMNLWRAWAVLACCALVLLPARALGRGASGVLSMRSNYVVAVPHEPPGGPRELALRNAVAGFFNGSSRMLRTIVGGPGTATLQVEHRLSNLAEIEDVAAALAHETVVEMLAGIGPVQRSWQEVFLEVEAGEPAVENAAVVRLTFKCRPEAAPAVVDGLFRLNEFFAELDLPRGRILVGLLGGPSSPEVMLEGEFQNMVTLEKAMKQLQGNERYTEVLHSLDVVDVAEEVLIAVDAPRTTRAPSSDPEG